MKQQFKCYLMNFSINNKNFSIYETKNLFYIKFEARATIKTVAKLNKEKYSQLIDELQDRFGYYAFDKIECFNYLCDKFNS